MASKALIYGLSAYTDAWARIRRGHKGFDLIPASGLDTLSADLSKHSKTKIVAFACWNDLLVSKVDGLNVVETLQPLVASVYEELLNVAKSQSIKVDLFLHV